MSGLNKLADKYAKMIKAINDDRDNFAMVTAKDAHALTALRIQEQGKDADEAKMPLYSRSKLKYWLINPTKFTAPGKIKKFKEDAEKGKNDGSYHALRQSYGLPTNKRTLTFDGNMFKSIIQKITKRNKVMTEVTIMAGDQENQKKVAANSKIVGKNILQFSEKEKESVKAASKKRFERLYNSVK